MYMEEHPYMCSQNRRHRDLHVSVQFGVYETYKPFSAQFYSSGILNNDCDTLLIFCLFIVLVPRGK